MTTSAKNAWKFDGTNISVHLARSPSRQQVSFSEHVKLKTYQCKISSLLQLEMFASEASSCTRHALTWTMIALYLETRELSYQWFYIYRISTSSEWRNLLIYTANAWNSCPCSRSDGLWTRYVSHWIDQYSIRYYSTWHNPRSTYLRKSNPIGNESVCKIINMSDKTVRLAKNWPNVTITRIAAECIVNIWHPTSTQSISDHTSNA
jgi:hypothetical protein